MTTRTELTQLQTQLYLEVNRIYHEQQEDLGIEAKERPLLQVAKPYIGVIDHALAFVFPFTAGQNFYQACHGPIKDEEKLCLPRDHLLVPVDQVCPWYYGMKRREFLKALARPASFTDRLRYAQEHGIPQQSSIIPFSEWRLSLEQNSQIRQLTPVLDRQGERSYRAQALETAL